MKRGINMINVTFLFLLVSALNCFGESALDMPKGYFASVEEDHVLHIYCEKAWVGDKLVDDSIECECTQLAISYPDTQELVSDEFYQPLS
jgi:hypothetical protein